MSKSRTAEAREFARELLNSQVYRENLKLRLMAGDLPANLEAMLFHYAYGKPVETLEVVKANDFERMSDEELLAAEKTLRELLPANSVH